MIYMFFFSHLNKALSIFKKMNQGKPSTASSFSIWKTGKEKNETMKDSTQFESNGYT